MTDNGEPEFEGAKLILFIGARIAVLRRDDFPGLAYAGCLDLPGGMREPGESPEDCVLRELREELGLDLPEEALIWRRFYAAPSRAWFFAAHIAAEREADIRFGDEGQGWALMVPEAFIEAPDAVPHFRDRVRAYLDTR